MYSPVRFETKHNLHNDPGDIYRPLYTIGAIYFPKFFKLRYNFALHENTRLRVSGNRTLYAMYTFTHRTEREEKKKKNRTGQKDTSPRFTWLNC